MSQSDSGPNTVVSSVSMPDEGSQSVEPLVGLQDDVYRKLGRSVIRLQQYELLMKDFLTRQRVEGPTESITDCYASQAEALSQRTLGQLVGAFTSSIFDDSDPDGFPLDAHEDEREWFSSGFTLGMSDEDRQPLGTSLATLVNLRNGLIHGFIAEYDISTEDGCVAAAAHLDASNTKIEEHFQQLRALHKKMGDLTAATAGLLAIPEISDHFFHGILPGGAGVIWPVSTIVGLLRQAETELAQDGWTRLEDAVTRIQDLAPDHTPPRYGCSTWPQVLHESRLFTIRRGAGDQSKQGSTWYQSNQQATKG